MNRDLYLLCRLYFDDVGFYGIYSDTKKLLEHYHKILEHEEMFGSENIRIFKFRENMLEGEFMDWCGFYENYEEICIQELKELAGDKKCQKY